MPTTTRGAFPYPALADVADVPLYMQNLANQIAGQAGLFTSGTLAARPASPAAADVDRFYFATDNGFLYRWSGSAWSIVNPTDAIAATGSMRTLGTGAQQAAAGNDARFTTTGLLSARPAAGTLNRRYYATDTQMLYFDTGTKWIVDGGISDPDTTILAFNAAWPASPVDGQETYRWADTNLRTLWRFRYYAANPAANRWVFVGGPPLRVTTTTPFVFDNAAGVTVAWVKMQGCVWTPGVAGDYQVAVQLIDLLTSAVEGIDIALSNQSANTVSVGTITVPDGTVLTGYPGGPQGDGYSIRFLKVGVVAGTALAIYLHEQTDQGWQSGADMYITPVTTG